MTVEPYLKFAFSLQGLIRSIVKGHGGHEYMDKCTREIAEALQAIVEHARAALCESKAEVNNFVRVDPLPLSQEAGRAVTIMNVECPCRPHPGVIVTSPEYGGHDVNCPAGIVYAVLREVRRQDEKHGPYQGASSLGVSRLALASLEDETQEATDSWRSERSKVGWYDTRAEVVQVAAVAIRTLRDAL